MKKVALVLAVLLVVIAAGVVFYIKSSKGIIVDQAAVEARALEILPGAKPPAGLKGVLAMSPEEDLQIVVFAPSLPKAKPTNLEGADLRIVIVKPKTDDPDIQVIKEKLGKVQEMRAEQADTLSESPVLLSVGGKPYPGMASEVSLKDNGAKHHEDMTIVMKGEEPVILLISGPTETYNTSARDEFLNGLNPPQRTEKLPGGLSMPEKLSDKLPERPAATATPTPGVARPDPPRRPGRRRSGPSGPPGKPPFGR